jgi:2-iminobutanoate/2-iminopropanoate deaminase
MVSKEATSGVAREEAEIMEPQQKFHLPYSPIVRRGNWLICAGQLGVRDGALAEGPEAQIRQALANLEKMLKENGSSLREVVKTMVFLTDMAQFDALNKVYAEVFPDRQAARTTVAVAGLPIGALVEIEAWAWTGG